MTGVYDMQRANGNCFALDNGGRFRVPLLHSNADAMMARLRNFGMLLFKPVELNTRLEVNTCNGRKDESYTLSALWPSLLY